MEWLLAFADSPLSKSLHPVSLVLSFYAISSSLPSA
jgi:hypothetical protein